MGPVQGRLGVVVHRHALQVRESDPWVHVGGVFQQIRVHEQRRHLASRLVGVEVRLQDRVPTKPLVVHLIEVTERCRPLEWRREWQAERDETPSKRVLVASAHFEPKVHVALHIRCEMQRRRIQPVIASLVDDDLARLEGPVIEVTRDPHEPPDGVVDVVLGQVGPECRATGAFLEVSRRVEQRGWVAERDVVLPQRGSLAGWFPP